MASENELRRLDLNLLLVFDVLYRQRSTTRAAESLHLTQPAVSNALKRLRTHFDDTLFVKSPDGMQPTPRAHEIAVLVDEGLSSFRLALEAGKAFEPASATRTFRLYVSDVGQAVFVPALAAHLQRFAPGVRIVTTDPPLEAAQQMMKLGQIDLAIGMFSGLPDDFHQQDLFPETYVALVRQDHPTIGKTVSIEEFFDAPQVIYSPTAGSHARFQALLNELAPPGCGARRVSLQLAHSFGLAQIVASTDLLACIPSRVARALPGREGFRVVPLPFDITPTNIAQFWHERYQRDEGHRWLRGLIYELFYDNRPCAEF